MTYKIKKLKLKNFAKFTDFELEFDNKITRLVGTNGSGKKQPYTEPVLTPTGYKLMKEIQKGSEVICPISGNSIKVIDVFHHKQMDTYKVSFNDGTYTECCDEHLWAVKTTKDYANKKQDYRVLSLRDIMRDFKKVNNSKKTTSKYKYAIPLTKEVEFKQKYLEMHPYVLGFLLGDGYLPEKHTISASVNLKEAKEIIERLKGFGANIHRIKDNPTAGRITFLKEEKDKIKSLGLLGHKSRTKFVPEQYLNSSIENRKLLLAGLLDTDGTISPLGKCRFNSYSKDLAEAVVFLVRSLGGEATFKEADDRGNKDYRVSFKTPYNPFLLKAKAERYKDEYRNHYKKKIVGIEYVGKKDGQCIQVDSKHGLYITRDFIVTHNTTVGLTSIWAGLKGISDRVTNGQMPGQRFRFIGEKASNAKIGIILVDTHTGKEIIVKNTISKDGNSITFESEQTLDENFLKDLFNASFLSAKNFSLLSGKEQAIALGLDTNEYDEKIKELKAEATILNRNVKAYGNLIEVEKPEETDVESLKEKRTQLQNALTESQKGIKEKNAEIEKDNKELQTSVKESNEKHTLLTQKYNRSFDAVNILRAEGMDDPSLDTFLNKIKVQIPEYISDIKLKEPIKEQNTTPEIEELTAKIEGALTTQSEATVLYNEYIRKKSELDKLQKDLSENKQSQEKVAAERLKYIRESKFKISGLDIDEEGNLTYKGKLIREPYFSKGELEIIVASLYAISDPQLKVRFVDDFESLDEENQEKLLKYLFSKDFQIITASVNSEIKKPNTIVLRECKILGEDNVDVEEGIV